MIVRTASKMRAHLDDFSGRLSCGLSKPARRFVGEALYGIAARGSVRLSEIGRALEEPIPLIKTETRLSRNLGREELCAHLGAAVLREGGPRIAGCNLAVKGAYLRNSSIRCDASCETELLAKGVSRHDRGCRT